MRFRALGKSGPFSCTMRGGVEHRRTESLLLDGDLNLGARQPDAPPEAGAIFSDLPRPSIPPVLPPTAAPEMGTAGRWSTILPIETPTPR